MLKLVEFELKKIFARRSAQLALAAVLLLSVLLGVSGYLNMYAFDGKSQEGCGGEAVRIDKEVAARYAGWLTDEKVQQMLADMQLQGDLHGLNPAYLYQNAIQSALFVRFVDLDAGWNGQTVAGVFGAEPIKIGYILGWLTSSQNLVKALVALALAIIIMLAPVFAGEYEGVNNLILTSRRGPQAGCLAKIIAALLAAVGVTLLTLAVNLGLALALYGTEGLDCSILFAPAEFSENYIPCNISCAQLLAYQILLALGTAGSVAGLGLLFSAFCRSQLAAFGAAAAVYLLPVVLPVAESSALFRLVVLLPLYQAQFVALMSVGQLSGGLLYAALAMPVAMVCFVAGAMLAWRIFVNQQVC